MKFCHGLLAIVLFFVPASAQPLQSPALTAAIGELNKGRLFEGIRKLKEIVRSESSPSAYFYLSGLYTEMGRYDSAYGYLKTAMTANPGQAAYYHQLGVIRRDEGCRPEALAAFQQALRIGMGKDEATVWRNIGDLYVDLLASDKAVDAYRNALRVKADDAAAHFAFGKLYLDLSDPDRAIVELRAARQASPALDGVYAALGRAYRASGDLQAAVVVLREGITRNPSDQESRYILGQILIALDRSDEGRGELQEYRHLQERITQTNTAFEAAVERARAGELDRAEEQLKETLRLAPKYAPALRVMGFVLLNRGKTQRAAEMLEQSLASNPLNPETYFNLGAAYFRAGKLPEALNMTEQALVLEEEDARYYTQLADIYTRMKRTAQGREANDRAAQLRSGPGYEPPDPYAAEMRRRDDAATVREICGIDH